MVNVGRPFLHAVGIPVGWTAGKQPCATLNTEACDNPENGVTPIAGKFPMTDVGQSGRRSDWPPTIGHSERLPTSPTRHRAVQCGRRMATLLVPFWSYSPRLILTAIADILCVAFVIYQFFAIIRGRGAAQILMGIAVLVGVYAIARWLRLEVLATLLATLAPYTAFGLIVMFQSEIRRTLAQIGQRRFRHVNAVAQREAVEEIVSALHQLSSRRIGGLIVIEQNIGLRTFIESGVPVDAKLSRDLLCAIFQPNGPLHDGAVIVRADRIVAAASFLPLTTNPQLLNELGTRHRAAIGATEEADCLALVASEETGGISIASGGEIEIDVTPDRLRYRLTMPATEWQPRRSGVAPHEAAAPRQ